MHAAADRPLGFDEVVSLAGERVTREQVRAASAHLCRGGDLDRIRSGVYQWSAGERSHPQPLPAATSSEPATFPARPLAAAPAMATRSPAARLFHQLFPSGVRMTAELLADFERWTVLTEKLAQHVPTS